MKKTLLGTLLIALSLTFAVSPASKKKNISFTNKNPFIVESTQTIEEERANARAPEPEGKTYAVDYNVITLCDFHDAPTTSGLPDPVIDKDGYIQFSASSNTIAYRLYETSFVLSFKLYIDHINSGANFWLGIRGNKFTRANYVPNSYVYRLSNLGHVEVWKTNDQGQASRFSSTGHFPFKAGVWYDIDLACVITNKGTMFLDVSVNGKSYASVEDTTPYTQSGMFVLTADGDITPTLTNASNLTYVFNKKFINDVDKIHTKLYFMNSVCSADTSYEKLNPRMLSAVNLDGVTIEELNDTYYALDSDSNHIKAVDMYFENNILNLVINKKLYRILDGSPVEFAPENLEILKTAGLTGLQSDQHYRLLFDYHLDLN